MLQSSMSGKLEFSSAAQSLIKQNYSVTELVLQMEIYKDQDEVIE